MWTIETIVDDFLSEAQEDWIGLWAISGAVRSRLKLAGNEEVKARTLDVVRGLLDHGLWPGDYLKMGFRPWDEPDAAACLVRIDGEWDATKGDPTLPESICWFDWKKK